MKQAITDKTIEHVVSAILRVGVSLSGSLVLAGGVYFLAIHGSQPADHQQFVTLPAQDRLLGRIIEGAIRLEPRAIIQFGILCLIATPIVRVGYSLIGFGIEGDRTYILITAIVLSILLSSLLSGAAGGA